jgi:hypothetical protein
MPRSVHRSAVSGCFVKASTVARHPGKTVTQTVGGQGRGHRSAVTGRFVTNATARRHPDTTISEGGT